MVPDLGAARAEESLEPTTTKNYPCKLCGDRPDCWLLETSIDHEIGLVGSREVPCPACVDREEQPKTGRKRLIGQRRTVGRTAMTRIRTKLRTLRPKRKKHTESKRL